LLMWMFSKKKVTKYPDENSELVDYIVIKNIGIQVA
jgi:hypothetical protein